MTLNLAYDATLARVRLTVSAAPAAAEYVHIERSTNQINWTTVRGGTAITLVSAAAMLDDYEFESDVVNYYRASYVDQGPITYVGTGSAASGVNASITPGLPASLNPGDLLVTVAAIRNSGTGTANVPTGWTAMATSGNLTVMGRRYATGDAAPLVTFTGGVANADTLARMVAFRNAELVPLVSAPLLNASAQNVTTPAAVITEDGCVALVAGWKQDDWTSVAAVPGFTEAWELTSATGDDASLFLDYVIQTTAANIAASSAAVTGGAAAISRAITLALTPAEYVTRDTSTITPALDGVWLKSLARPFLNRQVTVTDWSEITRPTRTGIFEVVGRTTPIAVSEVRGSRRWTLDVVTTTAAEASDMDLLLASGDLQFIHTPADCIVPGGYVSVGDTSQARLGPRSVKNVFSLPLTEVAAPGADVVGATITWQGLLNLYGSWSAVLAAHATWASLLELIGSPSDVIVS